MELTNKKILICDDSILFRKQIKECVETFFRPVEVYEAVDGNMAVSSYKQYTPDLVFMDIIMPNKDGISALADILEFDSNAKVIMISSVGTQSYIKTAIETGAKNFLQKPIEPECVEKIIKIVL